jgi:hypothetical protein
MSKCFYCQIKIILLLTLILSVFFSAPTNAISAQTTLAWDANDPVPDGYRIYQRTEGQAYDYSQPVWTGAGTTGTVNHLVEDTTYYFVVRAYSGTDESADSNEVSYFQSPPQVPTYSITVSDGPNGAISPGSTVTVNEGDDQAFNIIPDSGYRVLDVTVDGSSVGAVNTYTFTNIAANHSISASFAAPEGIDDDSDGYTENQGDCDDDNASIHPGAGEICGDGIDQDCNGMDLPCDDNATGTTVVFGHTPEADFSDTVQDTFINLNAEVNTSSDRLNTYTWPSNMPANAVLMKFDLSQLPAGAQIQSAILTLYQTDAGGDASYDVSVHKVINHNPDLQAATGYTYDGVSSWSDNSSCYNNIPLAQADTAPAEDINRLDLSAGYKNWEVTAMVQDWVNNPTSNYGMLLNSDAVAGSNSYRFFASSEESDPTLRPSLELTYFVNTNQSGGVNQAPAADAGPDQTVDEGHTVTLSGLNSVDPDDGIAAFRWRQVQGETVVLSSPDQAETTFTAPDVDSSGASLVFELLVTDYSGQTTVDSCIVNVTWVNMPPTAVAGNAQTVSEGTTVVLDAAGSVDPDDGIVAYQWQQIQGPAVALTGSQSARATFSAPDIDSSGASLTFQLTVTDAGGLQDTDTCLVTVSWVNTPPVADAGPDQQVNAGEEVFLDGSMSTDKDGDSIVSYRWRQSDGTPVELSDATAQSPSFIAPETVVDEEQLTFELTVTDSGQMIDKDSCSVVVLPSGDTPPVLMIDEPANDTITTKDLRIDLAGRAWDDDGIQQVVWRDDSGDSGVASGTTQWRIEDLWLSYGTNVITVSAIDSAGNITSVQQTVEVNFFGW